MQHKPFHLHHLYLKFKYLDHINQHQVAPGVDGLKLTVFFGGSKAESRPIRYLQRAEEIELNFQLEVHSISASKVEIWLSRANRFLAAGEIRISDLQSEEYCNLTIESQVVASLSFTAEYVKEDISKEIVIEEDEVILKKDDTEFLRQQALEREREIQMKREQEEQEAIRRAQAKKPLITVTTSTRSNETYL